MKNIILIALFGFLFVTACQPRELPSQINVSPQSIELKVSHQSNQAELDKFKADLEKEGFTMDFTGSEFNPDGKIKILKFEVRTPKKTGAASTVEFSKLKYNYYGFTYDRVKGIITVGEQEE
jgi:hypothetical protein